MTIAQRLNILLIASILSMLIILGLSFYGQKQIITLDNQILTVEKLHSTMLEMRRHEKDFSLRKEIKYVDAHEQSFQLAQTLLVQLDASVVGSTQAITQQIQLYRDAFQHLVSLQKTIGLTPEDGLYGTLRTAVHNIESDLKKLNQHELIVDMLMMRRHEKDFMLRNDPKYAESLSKSMESLVTKLHKGNFEADQLNKFLKLAADYDAAFSALVAAQKQLGVKGVKGELENMRSQAHLAEEALSVFMKSAIDEKNKQQLQNEITSWVMTVLAIITLLSIVLWTRRNVLSALTSLRQEITQVTQTSNFKTPISYNQKDEIGEVSSSLNQLLSSLDQSISEANRVVGAIAHADFDQRVTGKYVGDLETLKQGINASANSVSFMMNELEKVMKGLNAGNFDVRMDTKVPQAFRNLVETALNNISGVVKDINLIMQKMSDGSFDAKVSADAQGDLLVMKDAVNQAMQNTASVIHSIVSVVEAQAQGDLTKTLSSGVYKGQFHDLKNAMTYSAEKVKESVIKAIQASHVVNDAANQVAQGASSLSVRVQEQAAALEQTSATMNEMSTVIQTSTVNAQRVASLAHQVQDQTSAGVDVMQQTISAMQSIKASSSKIADIVSLIDGIAFQTNLLALNAAVEAARAGEQGRGFAVVAGEVRSLAQKAAEAAKDIKQLITDSVSRIEVGTELADKSGEMLSGITGSIEQVACMIGDIANASREQTQGIGQVHRAVADIDRVTQENAALVEETSAAAESLTHQARDLADNMSFFKTGVNTRSRLNV